MAKKPEQTAQVKARVLVAGTFGKADDVVLVDSGEASTEIDKDPDAVAYAESIRQE